MTDLENDDARQCTWREAFNEALTLGPDALRLMHLLDLVDGKSDIRVPIDDLAGRLDVKPTTVRSMLTRLEASGWVSLEPQKRNGRAVLVPFTAVEVQ